MHFPEALNLGLAMYTHVSLHAYVLHDYIVYTLLLISSSSLVVHLLLTCLFMLLPS